MHRRTFLTATVTGSVGVLAGCSGGSGGGSAPDPTEAETTAETATATQTATETATPTATPTPTAPNIEAAREDLSQAGALLDQESENLGSIDEGGSFDTEAIHAALDGAETHLDDAEAAGEGSPERIEALRNMTAFVRSLTDAIADYGDGLGGMSTATTYSEGERFDDAIDELDAAETAFQQAQDHLSMADSHREAVDTDAMEATDEVSMAEVSEGFDAIRAATGALVTMVRGYRDFNRGLADFQTGTTEAEAENHEAAASAYGDAQAHFEAARSRFESGEGTAPQSFRDAFIGLTCEAGAMRDAADHFNNAMNAAQRGDQESLEEEAAAGEAAAARCGA